MTTAQQLGLVGNSVRVQALPTASAETFGQGNRYYTLIGQQEGYITGHTYHTVVANDVYSWEDVAQAGPPGEDGLPALVCNDTWGFLKVGLFNSTTETFNRTPIVGEKVVIFSTENQYALATIESVSETTVGVRFSGPIIYTKGATGPQGPAGTTVYNNLSDIPVINQDLTASGFTPVANTYYRHTGATTDMFTQGVIYLYDTAYHKLGESGGGTTFNKYNYSGNDITLARKIMENAKLSYINLRIDNVPCALLVVLDTYNRASGTVARTEGIVSVTITDSSGNLSMQKNYLKNVNNELTLTTSTTNLKYVSITYYNYTEITA